MISKSKIKYIHSLELKKNRKAEGVFVAEGYKLVGDLLPYFQCLYLAATEEWIEHNQEILSDLSGTLTWDCVTDEELIRISFVDTPQQVLAVFRQPQYRLDLGNVALHNIVIALDGVQNPGNLGTIIRVADWFGISDVLCSFDCADVFNPKTVQATMGALARVRIHYVDLYPTLQSLPAEVPVYGTFLDGTNIYNQTLTSNGVIVMGNEGRGVSDKIQTLCSERLLIPNYPFGQKTSESLNVSIATAIICSEFCRRIR